MTKRKFDPINYDRRHLYIVGNGFDLHHKLKTSFDDFGLFLQDHEDDIYEWLLKTCGLPQLPPRASSSEKDAHWSDFENALAEFRAEEIWECVRDYMNDADPHRSGDASWEAEKYINNLTINMRKAFKSFILEVEYPHLSGFDLIDIENNAIFLSFNYTNTLERIYKINNRNILYIHGNANSNDNLILGHGVNPKEFEQPIKTVRPPNGLTNEQYEAWQDEMSNQYIWSLELTETEIEYYYRKLFKNTREILEENESFFEVCADIHKITVLGHSLSDIDSHYIREISCRNKGATWQVSFYGQAEKERHQSTLLSLGLQLNHINLFEMKEMSKL